MRRGWNPRLAELVKRPDPLARVMVEALAVQREDVRNRKSEWDTADSLTGLVSREDGGVELVGAEIDLLSNTVENGYQTDLDHLSPSFGALIEWAGDEPASVQIHEIEVKLNHAQGGSQEVDLWVMQPFRVAAYQDVLTGQLSLRDYFVLQPLSDPVEVEATSGIANVVFPFDGVDARPLPFYPKAFGAPGRAQKYPGLSLGLSPFHGGTIAPMTVVFIWALKQHVVAGQTEPEWVDAANVGWARNSAVATHVVQGDNYLKQWRFDKVADSADLEFYTERTSQPNGVPYIVLRTKSYAQATAAFTGANLIDLGAAPAKDVEFVSTAEEPLGTDAIGEVLADDNTTWVPVRDGDLAETDNTPSGGANLSSTGTLVTRRQTYKMRSRLLPDALGLTTPIARELGARELERRLLDGNVEVSGPVWAITPLTGKGEIAQAEIRVTRSGPPDGFDPASDLLARYNPKDLTLRVLVGHPTRLARGDWMHIDTFLVDDYRADSGSVEFLGLSPLATLRGVMARDQPEPYVGQSLAAVYTDMVESQAAVPERFRGPGVENDSFIVSKVIPREMDVKDEIDRIAFFDGGGVYSDQGLIRYANLLGAKRVVHVFRREEFSLPAGAGAGLRTRMPEYFAKFGWDEDREDFAGEVQAFNETALSAIGELSLDAPGQLDEEAAKWLDQVQAQELATRMVTLFGYGSILFPIQPVRPCPELTVGDMVALEAVEFVARDPVRNRELRGRLWALGVVYGAVDPMGRELWVWARTWADILPADVNIEAFGFTDPRIADIHVRFDAQGFVFADVYANAAAARVRILGDATDAPLEAEVLADGQAVNDRLVESHQVKDDAGANIRVAPGVTVRVGAIAFERTDEAGAVSELIVVSATRPLVPPPTLRPEVLLGSNGATADVNVLVTSPEAEKVSLRMRPDDGTEWVLVTGNGSSTRQYYPSGSNIIGGTEWFMLEAGGVWAQKLNDIVLARDQITRILLQAEGEHTLARSDWTVVPLNEKRQPWLESIALEYDPSTGQLRLRAVGGGFCASARFEVDDDAAFGSPKTPDNASLADGGTHESLFALTAAERGKLWYGRVTPWNGPGQTGTQGVPQRAQVFVPFGGRFTGATLQLDASNNVDLTTSVLDLLSLRFAASKTGMPSNATVDAASLQTTVNTTFQDVLTGLAPGETGYVKLVGYQNVDGTGAKTDYHELTITRPTTVSIVQWKINPVRVGTSCVAGSQAAVALVWEVEAPAGYDTAFDRIIDGADDALDIHTGGLTNGGIVTVELGFFDNNVGLVDVQFRLKVRDGSGTEVQTLLSNTLQFDSSLACM